eukprot:NODE_1292_length_1183_cov_307.601950.p1 GENE.NODE_1292_length_1183_cov_307.601950~~NODE_1292_length_1183_cov_307.601950.p1  ORF type:complete len:357 (-),score=71.33 NODE_1292_length_1183_cov_307.601950:95-1165(-)
MGVDFGQGKGLMNVHVKTQIKAVPLAGGFSVGDTVTSLINHANVVTGDIGTVIGPNADAAAPDGAERVEVDFGQGKGLMNVHVKTQIKAAPPATPEPAAAALPTATAVAALRSKRWGDGLEAPASGARNFFPHGFVVARDVPEAVKQFGHDEAHVTAIVGVGRMKAQTSPMPIAAMHAAALFAYTEESPLYSTLNHTMRTPHSASYPTDTQLQRYADYIVHLQNALHCLPAHVSEVQGKVYRGMKVLLPPQAYPVTKTITWQAFTSATKSVMATLTFLDVQPGRRLQGSLFIIESMTAKDVRHFSQYPSEEEVVFLPNSQFVVERILPEDEKSTQLPDLTAYGMADLDVLVLRQVA